jgi:hypothetical protein
MARRKYREPEQSTMPELENKTLEGFEFSAWTCTEKIDNRQSKTYSRKVTLTGYARWDGVDWPFDNVTGELKKVFGLEKLSVYTDRGYKPRGETRHGLSWTITFPRVMAEKPSLIVGEGEAWAELGFPPKTAFAKVISAIINANVEWANSAELEDRARQADTLRDWAKKIIVAKAEEVCRYDQRLAALKAELTAEINVQCKKMLPELTKDAQEHDWKEDGNKFHPRAIEVGLEHALEQARKEPTSGFFRGGSHDSISAEDVTRTLEHPRREV